MLFPCFHQVEFDFCLERMSWKSGDFVIMGEISGGILSNEVPIRKSRIHSKGSGVQNNERLSQKVHLQRASILHFNFAPVFTRKFILDLKISGFGNINPSRFWFWFHTGGYVYCITPDVVLPFFYPNNTRYNRPDVHPPILTLKWLRPSDAFRELLTS